MNHKTALANAMGVNVSELTMYPESYSVTYKRQMYIVNADGGVSPFELIKLIGFNIKESTITIQEGASKKLTIENKQPSNANEQIIWTSSDETIATVDSEGNVTGVKAGSDTAIITAKSQSNEATSTTSCVVTVEESTTSYIMWNKKADGSYEEVLTPTKPANWGDYDNGEWGNIKTTKNGIECYWVWIPRFAYKVSDMQSETAKEVDVQLVDKTVTGTTTISGTQYLVHPAFTFGEDELDGFWVAKFEASAYDRSTGTTTTGGGNSTVQIKPDVESWRNMTSSSIFTVCQHMTWNGGALIGIATDSHMIKNSEWGAIAILSQSKYGIYNPTSLTGRANNGGDGTLKIWTNTNGYNSGASIKTGYVGDAVDASTTYNSLNAPSNVYLWNTVTGPKASTTGTIYGVYDMAGGSAEYVAGLYSNSNISKLGNNIDAKYYDVNADAESDLNKTLAITGWNSANAVFPNERNPILSRGISYHKDTGIFTSNFGDGSNYTSVSFRPVWVE